MTTVRRKLLSAYQASPVWVQNISFSLYGLHVRRLRYSRDFHSTLDELLESQWWDKERIERNRDERLIEIVRDAYENVPFYRKFYDEHGVDVGAFRGASDIGLLPILTKDIVRENLLAMRSRRFARRDLFFGRTSGTTGTPLTIMKTRSSVARQWAIWWRHKSRFGLVYTDRHLMVGAGSPVDVEGSRPPFWRVDLANHRTYLSSYHVSRANVREIAAYLSSQDFKFYTGYPSAILELVRLLEEEGIEIENGPRVVVTGSDALLPASRDAISDKFDARVTEQYGMAEFAGNLSECEHGSMHVDHECCHVETRDLVGTGAKSLILTGFWNPAMPFIRYEIGDTVGQVDEFCPCGRYSAVFGRVDGRMDDYVVTPDGRRIQGMNQVLKYAENAKAIQIFQSERDAIEFRVVANGNIEESDKRVLVEEFTKRAGSGMKIRFTSVEKLEVGPSGKIRAVVSRVDAPERPGRSRRA